MRVLKNYPFGYLHIVKQPIAIIEGEEGWEEAYKTWLSGKNPTSDPRWKEGVFLSIGLGEYNNLKKGK